MKVISGSLGDSDTNKLTLRKTLSPLPPPNCAFKRWFGTIWFKCFIGLTLVSNRTITNLWPTTTIHVSVPLNLNINSKVTQFYSCAQWGISQQSSMSFATMFLLCLLNVQQWRNGVISSASQFHIPAIVKCTKRKKSSRMAWGCNVPDRNNCCWAQWQ